ncbi:MAG: PP2C family protein-serine/threonine phosphatase [Planctomycetota bacterium]
MDDSSNLEFYDRPEMPWFSPDELTRFSKFLTGDPKRDTSNVQALLTTFSEIVGERNVDSILERYLGRVLETTRAERAIILLYEDGELRVRLARDHGGADLGTNPPLSRTVTRATAVEGRPLMDRVTSQGEVLRLSSSIMHMRLRQVMCVPLRARGQTLGVLYVDSTAQPEDPASTDLMLLNAHAGLMAMAIENSRLLDKAMETSAVREQLEVARRIQARLLPSQPAHFCGLELAGLSEPCENVGGDYFDYFALDNDTVGLSVGDVSGHGIASALIMADVRAHLRSLLGMRSSLQGLYGILNRSLCADLDGSMFVSLFVAIFDQSTGRLGYHNAGHNPPLVYRPSRNEFYELAPNAPALGIVDELSAGVTPSVDLKRGDLLICYTDGVTEARSPEGELFGESRLKETVEHAARGGGANEIVDSVRRRMHGHTGGESPRDDITLLVARNVS